MCPIASALARLMADFPLVPYRNPYKSTTAYCAASVVCLALLDFSIRSSEEPPKHAVLLPGVTIVKELVENSKCVNWTGVSIVVDAVSLRPKEKNSVPAGRVYAPLCVSVVNQPVPSSAFREYPPRYPLLTGCRRWRIAGECAKHLPSRNARVRLKQMQFWSGRSCIC